MENIKIKEIREETQNSGFLAGETARKKRIKIKNLIFYKQLNKSRKVDTCAPRTQSCTSPWYSPGSWLTSRRDSVSLSDNT